MPQSPLIMTLITFFHDLFTAIWIGGLFTLTLSVSPAVKQTLGMSPELKKIMAAVQARHSKWVYASIAGLALTGLLMSRRVGNGLLFSFANPASAVLSVKHILMLAMVLVTLYRSLFAARESRPGDKSVQKKSMLLMIANLAMGTVVLLLSAYLTAIG